MQILCHRGWWKNSLEQNTLTAFQHAFEHGMGVETDVRDFNCEIVISHDLPVEGALKFSDFLSLYKTKGNGVPLALNIKSDGLYPLLYQWMQDIDPSYYFFFDMSIPDTLSYYDAGEPFFSRQSEYEPVPAFYDTAPGVWLDCFDREWYSIETIKGHLDAGKQVCLVSPELHRRPHQNLWKFIHAHGLHREPEVLLCTDFPQEARNLFKV